MGAACRSRRHAARVLCAEWFNVSDAGVVEALYESPALRCFAGMELHPTDKDLSAGTPAPDETTVCRFRHLLEKHDLGGQILHTVNHYLAAKGIKIATGTIVDATILHAPSSTRNKPGERDPEMQGSPPNVFGGVKMHQTRTGKHWYFGLRCTSASTAKKASCTRCVPRRPR